MQADHAQTPIAEAAGNEVAWDLLRDEWELLMVIGHGSSSLREIASLTGEPSDGLMVRLETMVDYGLLACDEVGYRLLPLVHRRKESMSTYLDDLLLSRIDLEAPPVELTCKQGSGEVSGLGLLHDVLDREVIPKIVELASVEETDSSCRYLLVFVATTNTDLTAAADPSVAGFLQVLRAGALERARADTSAPGDARVWVAEMSVEPPVAAQIARLLVGTIRDVPSASFGGALTSGMWMVQQGTPEGSQEEEAR